MSAARQNPTPSQWDRIDARLAKLEASSEGREASSEARVLVKVYNSSNVLIGQARSTNTYDILASDL